jgi:hypothetical protein
LRRGLGGLVAVVDLGGPDGCGAMPAVLTAAVILTISVAPGVTDDLDGCGADRDGCDVGPMA